MAGRSRFRHGRKRSASGVITVRQEDRTPLERLAGYLETELAAKESKAEEKYPRKEIDFLFFKLPLGPRLQKYTEYKNLRKTVIHLSPKGKRHPRVSHHKGHITVSWLGDRGYHRLAWHKKVKKPGNLDYEVNIFFKGTLAASDDWKKIYDDFGGANPVGSQKAWDDITSNNFVVVTRNTAAPLKNPWRFLAPLLKLLARIPWSVSSTLLLRWHAWALRKRPTVAYLSKRLGAHGKAFNDSLEPLKQWRWFGFPGIGQKPEPGGQFVGRIPGMTKVSLLGLLPLSKIPAGHCMFKDEDDCGLAVVTKVYPKKRKHESYPPLELTFQSISSALRLILLAGFILGLPYMASWGVSSYLNHEDRAELEVALEEATTEIEDLAEENVALSEDNAAQADEIERLNKLPQGLDHPPCWYNKDTGLEYLFNIRVSEKGLTVTRADENKGATADERRRRDADYVALQINKSNLGRTMSVPEFQRIFKPVFKASQDAIPECRHFALIHEDDLTDVNRYRRHRDAIEGYFYIKRTGRKDY